jgi:sec-independent protein translocase protein TatA
MFFRGLEGWHIVIIVALIAVLFGSRRMPDAARSIGQSLRIFKSEMKAASADDEHGAARVAEPVVQPTPVIASGPVSAAPFVEAVEPVAAPVPVSRAGTSAL